MCNFDENNKQYRKDTQTESVQKLLFYNTLIIWLNNESCLVASDNIAPTTSLGQFCMRISS